LLCMLLDGLALCFANVFPLAAPMTSYMSRIG
jgi:hypothetical protein